MATAYVRAITCDTKGCDESVLVHHDWGKAKQREVLRMWGRLPTRTLLVRDLCPAHWKEHKKGMRVELEKRSVPRGEVVRR